MIGQGGALLIIPHPAHCKAAPEACLKPLSHAALDATAGREVEELFVPIPGSLKPL